MSGNPFINCPICNHETYFSAADGKIIDCRTCGAPVCDIVRPAAGSDLRDYQNRLREWGKQSEHISSAQLEAHIKSNRTKQQKQSDDFARLQLQTKLKVDLQKLSSDYQSLQRKYDADVTQKVSKLENDIQSQADSYTQLRSQYHALQLGIQEIYKQAHKNAQELDRGWESLKQLNHETSKDVLDKLKSLGADDSSTANDSNTEGLQALQIDTDSSAVESEGDKDFEGNSRNLPFENRQPDDSAENSPLPTDNSSTESSSDDAHPSSLPSIPTVRIDQPEPGAKIPAWLSRYNSISSPVAARQFRETFRAIRLMVPQDSLEHQRVVTEDSSPMFTQGQGSYWCIPDAPTQAYFLVLDRERFAFNISNYESITVCYTFNDIPQSNFKYFKPSSYELSTYQIIQPAQVTFNEDMKVWTLFSRGRMMFTKKSETIG